MSENTQNPREALGGNFPPLARSIAAEENFAGTVTAFLEDEYRQIPGTVAQLLEEARAIPQVIEDEPTMGTVAKLIKRLRDEAAKIEAYRVKETEPYLRGGQAVNSFFFALREKCIRKDRQAKPGAADILQGRLDDYNQRKLAAERERLRQEAERSRREREEAERREREAAEKAEADRLAAERARKPETQQAKADIAEQSAQAASQAKIDADRATADAEAAHIATLAKPADIVRTRVNEGPTVTMATEPYALVEDFELLDKAALWPFIKQDAIEQALRAWARTTGHNQQMAGAKIGRRPKTVVR